MNTKKISNILLLVSIILLACNTHSHQKNNDQNNTQMKTIETTYTLDSITMHGYVAYNENISTKRPGILVVPEWWGLNEYAKKRARELSDLGYIAMAVDIYGNGKQADNPDLAGKLAEEFYKNPAMAKARFDAAVTKLKTYPQTDTANMAAIGYCFGGGLLLNAARLGEDLKGVVSFHGSLLGTPAQKNILKANILVLHGADDKFVSATDVETFKKEMDSIGANYKFISYPGATHAFTNPDATAMGKKFNMPIAYNSAADTASWNEMKVFLTKLFK